MRTWTAGYIEREGPVVGSGEAGGEGAGGTLHFIRECEVDGKLMESYEEGGVGQRGGRKEERDRRRDEGGGECKV